MSATPKGTYYYMKLRNGVKKTAGVKARVDKLVNEKLEELHRNSSAPIDLKSILVDKV